MSNGGNLGKIEQAATINGIFVPYILLNSHKSDTFSVMADQALFTSVSRLLRPLVNILMRHGISFAEFAEIAKQIFVETADEDFKIEGRKQTISRVAMLTGIQRKEVSRLRKIDEAHSGELDAAYNRAVRVAAGWCRDKRFTNAQGNPRPLPFEGEHSFSELAKKYSGDVPARAVLDEFIRVGTVMRNEQDEICLVNESGYVPHGHLEAQFNILGSTSRDLIRTLSHNIECSPQETRLQLTVAYNNLPAQAVTHFRYRSREESIALLKKFDSWLASEDRDANGNAPAEDGRFRAGIGIYYFEEPVPNSPAEEISP